jgi:hypothetical protein
MTQIAKEAVTKIIPLTFGNFVTPKARAKNELLYSTPVSAKIERIYK